MMIVCLSNGQKRIIGYLKSISLEISPGIFIATNISKKEKEKVWNTINEWYENKNNEWYLMIEINKNKSEKYIIKNLGQPKRKLLLYEGIWITYTPK